MSSLGQKARSAVIWNAGFNIFRDLLQFGTMLVLVRLLEPEAYGQFGLVTSIIGFISILSFNNFIAHTLQVKSDDEAHYQDHFTAGTVIQASLFLLCNLLALCLWWMPTYEAIAPLVHAMSLLFLFGFPCDFRIKILERQLDWKRLRLLHAIGLLITTVVAILMAAAGAGAYALLLPGILVTLPFVFDLFANLKWKPDWTWSWQRFKPAWQFGLSRIGSCLATNGKQLLESGVLAKVLGFATLGFVNRAMGLAQIFCMKFASQLMYSLYPMLARQEQGSASFRRASGLVLRSVAWVVIPLGLIFSVLAGPVVRTVYGNKWLEVIPLLPWGMAFGVTAAMAHAGYMLVLASQRQNWCLALDCVALLGTGISLFVLLPLGLIPYLAGVTCVQLIICAASAAMLLRLQSVAWDGLAVALLPPLVSALLVIALCEGLAWVSALGKSALLGALVYGTIFCVGYAVLLRLLFEKHLGELVSYLPASQRLRRALRLH
ncbi:MAG: oligosaccharide flippase family protein [Verrucomicrobia bacterium]|nr:oligosaccharide flippase family protein [Verrucomicrobiota bacterium]